MIIELTGIPGAGKTTMARELVARHGYVYVECNTLFMPGDAQQRGLLRWIVRPIAEMRGLLSAVGGLVTSSTYRTLLREMFHLLKTNRCGFFNKANIVRNTLHKIAAHRTLDRRRATIHIVDEGFTHLPQSLLVDGAPPDIVALKRSIARLVSALPMPSILVILDIDRQTATTRVAARGHRRFGGCTEVITAHLENAQLVATLSAEEFARLHGDDDHKILSFLPEGNQAGRDPIDVIAATMESITCSR